MKFVAAPATRLDGSYWKPSIGRKPERRCPISSSASGASPFLKIPPIIFPSATPYAKAFFATFLHQAGLVHYLVNRISVPLSRCSVNVLLRTGDHPTPLRDKKVGVLVTTLESLDSLLCRWAVQLLDIKAIVFEELHVAEGTARGDQLAVLAERLDVL